MLHNVKIGEKPCYLINFPEILKSQTRRLNPVNNQYNDVMYMRGYVYVHVYRMSWDVELATR